MFDAQTMNIARQWQHCYKMRAMLWKRRWREIEKMPYSDERKQKNHFYEILEARLNGMMLAHGDWLARVILNPYAEGK